GQVNATTYLVSLSLSREITVVKWPRVFLNAFPQNYQMPHGPLPVRRADGTRHYGCVPWRGVYVCKSKFKNPHPQSAQLRTLWLCKNPFSGVHESGRDLFLRWSSEVRKNPFHETP